MSRKKLIAKYAALDTPDLEQRIYDEIQKHISEKGIEDIPFLELNGRWTGTLSISDGGWRGDFDFLYRLISMCRVNRDGVVSPDMEKIKLRVADWRNYLYTPGEYDRELGVDDDHFDDTGYLDDGLNDLRSMAYNAEFDSFMSGDGRNFYEYDQALTEIDELCCPNDSNQKAEDDRIFEEGFSIQKITSADDFIKIMQAMEQEAVDGAGISWVNPDLNIDELLPSKTENDWMQFIDDLRNHRFGELPEDYDGLADPDED